MQSLIISGGSNDKIKLDQMRSACPIANVLDLVGDKHRYSEFLVSDEGIPINILADRLKRLEQYGIIEKRPYQHNPVRNEYHLTAIGHDLRPMVMEMVNWGLKHIPGTGHQ